VHVRIFPAAELAARAVARRIVAAIRVHPTLTLGVAAGRTPMLVYESLIKEFEAGRVDFSRVTTFSLDEFLGVKRNDPGSFHTLLSTQLFSRINMRPSAIHSLNGAARNPEEECARYEKSLRRAGGIDLQILGLGANGHVAFNEPGPWLHARTHKARLLTETRRANAQLFGGRLVDVPRVALSMGMGTILGARKIALLATGKSKAKAVAQMLGGRCSTQLPASLLQLHPNVEVILDGEAAGHLAG
jgi:glucosamine-6-phosphate deaminase